MRMNRDRMKAANLTMVLLAAAGLCLGGGVAAQTMSKEAHDMAVSNAESQYKVDAAACDTMSGNAKDVCIEQAKGNAKVTKAEADAAAQNTPKAREAARLAQADATYAVAKQKCDDLAGNPKDVCLKEANATYVKAKADAKVDRVAAVTRKEAADKTNEARREADADKTDAEYKVAVEKCDALAGAAKDGCVRDAKARYGKN
jgi:hypothetical protein